MSSKILFISEFPEISSSEKRNINIIKELIKNGHEIDLLFFQNSITLLSTKFFTKYELSKITNLVDEVGIHILMRIVGKHGNNGYDKKEIKNLVDKIITDRIYNDVLMFSKWNFYLLNTYKSLNNITALFNNNVINEISEKTNQKSAFKKVKNVLVQGEDCWNYIEKVSNINKKKMYYFNDFIIEEDINRSLDNNILIGDHIKNKLFASERLRILYVDTLGSDNNHFEELFVLDSKLHESDLDYEINVVSNLRNDNYNLVEYMSYYNSNSDKFMYLLENSFNINYIGRREQIANYIVKSDIVLSFSSSDKLKMTYLESSYFNKPYVNINYKENNNYDNWFKSTDSFIEFLSNNSTNDYKINDRYKELSKKSIQLINMLFGVK